MGPEPWPHHDDSIAEDPSKQCLDTNFAIMAYAVKFVVICHAAKDY